MKRTVKADYSRTCEGLPFSRYRAVAERCSVLPLRCRRKMQGVYRRN